MSGFSVQVDDARLTAALLALRTRIGNLQLVMASIGQRLVTQTDLAFRSERDPWGNAWQRLSRSTLRQRRTGKGTGGAKILRDTGRLAGSISYRASADQVVVGTNVVYAAIHQFGGDIQRKAHTLYFRTNRAGTVVGNRFVRKAKSNFALTVGPYSIHIPPRPFLSIDASGRADLPMTTVAAILADLRTSLQQAMA
jgi:phage virion morphogenesis protein